MQENFLPNAQYDNYRIESWTIIDFIGNPVILYRAQKKYFGFLWCYLSDTYSQDINDIHEEIRNHLNTKNFSHSEYFPYDPTFDNKPNRNSYPPPKNP